MTEAKFCKNSSTQNHKSIFQYVTNPDLFVNNNKCLDTTPPFLAYIPKGIQKNSIDIENELRGTNRPITKCQNCKYHGNQQLVQNTIKPENKEQLPECSSKILPKGYGSF